ncbi:MAG: S-methyl-5'-thioadenosine phosphorylase [Chloroflexi bacterium]|nr:S-methyl-5'-thioadenosine phosphorylase [Chloroflexota bacterium]|tara:strand:- start:44249 stop:45109 length:861 start_codon:yes stop_codon:yes gene_type:complete
MKTASIGIIGGSGLYHIDNLTELDQIQVKTPFGDPSDTITIGRIGSENVAFLPRHGKGHTINPSELPSRANIYALKSIGVKQIISISAVGSLDINIKPQDMIVPNQLIDRTKARESTFFEKGIVAHVGLAEPFCPTLRKILIEGAENNGTKVHTNGTYVVMEGPAFSTKAESELYRSWNASIIGMTALPEAKLAREAEICYATLACVTDYDVWHDDFENVTVEMVIKNLQSNVANSRKILASILPNLPDQIKCKCNNSLKDAIISDLNNLDPKIVERLNPIIHKYI